ncbi:sensor histidine kinase [Litchfieldia salsa]|uniref:histidine kinase n=1 Tax=Litchfieldia salsa TaxID=930152 RepID=A0A1H0WAU9_9BACI|nr:ATP-binding protein [Litchfieldia salsa]SDP87842.1 His Kinase A (phospho-acceptor) domain-containing protein [Litchfieldia salsa]
MLRTLRSKVLFYFIVLSLCAIFLTSFSILWGFEEHFTEYLQEDREGDIKLINEEVIKEYKETGNYLSIEVTSLLHQQAMTNRLFYQIYNGEGELLVDTTNMLGMMERMGPAGEGLASEYQTGTYDIKLDNRNIGTTKVYYPKGLYGAESTFFNTIKQYIFGAAMIILILSSLFSMLFSKRLTDGFTQLTRVVRELQNHKRDIRMPIEILTEEMVPLAESFNDLAESLSKEEILRKRFTADLAHELRTPLATLRSQIEAYQDGIWEPTPNRLQQSHNELMRLVRLVNEMENLLAAENPQIKLQKTDIELWKILTHIKNQFDPLFYEKAVNLKVIEPLDEHWIFGDKDRIIQILTNIINNAFQYTSSGKSVSISIVKQNQFVGFVVKDEGVGIGDEDLPYLYERFFRGDKSRDRQTGGIGIGLSIVKALVDAHHGEVQIISELKKGTTVTVLFPYIERK